MLECTGVQSINHGKEFSGNDLSLTNRISVCVIHPSDHYSQLIHTQVVHVGTRDRLLSSLHQSQCGYKPKVSARTANMIPLYKTSVSLPCDVN